MYMDIRPCGRGSHRMCFVFHSSPLAAKWKSLQSERRSRTSAPRLLLGQGGEPLRILQAWPAQQPLENRDASARFRSRYSPWSPAEDAQSCCTLLEWRPHLHDPFHTQRVFLRYTLHLDQRRECKYMMVHVISIGACVNYWYMAQ